MFISKLRFNIFTNAANNNKEHIMRLLRSFMSFTRHEKTSLSSVKGVGKGALKAIFDKLMPAFNARQSLTLTTPLTAVIDSKGRLCLTFDPCL